MTVPLFAGNQLQDFAVTTGASEFTTNCDTAWVPNSVGGGGPTITTPQWTPQTSIWLHANLNLVSGLGSSLIWFHAYNSSGVERVRITNPGVLQYWNGTTWVTAGSGASLPSGQHTHDWNIVINGASSSITWYVDKISFLAVTGDFSGVGNIGAMGFGAPQSVNSGVYVSEVIAHTLNTINRRYNLRLPSANGANTGFTGSYTDVNEAVTDNSTFIYTPTVGAISTFPTAGKDLTGYAVDCVTVSNVSLVDVTGPQHEQWALRIGGANYFSGADVAVANGFTQYRSYIATNPATGVGWTAADAGAASLEVGLKATT